MFAHSPLIGAFLCLLGGMADDTTISATAGSVSVTRDAAVELALGRRPAAEAAGLRVEAANLDRRQARAWQNPELELEVEGFGGDRPGFDEAEFTVGIAGGLDLLGRARTRGAAADAAMAVEVARAAAQRRVLAGEVRMAFHRVLSEREYVQLAGESLETRSQTLDAIQNEVAAGKAPALRGLQAEAAWEAERVRYDEARSRLARAEARLSRLTGGPAHATVVADGALRSAGAALSAESLREELTASHPEVLIGLRTEAFHRDDARRVARERWPELGYRLGYRHSRGEEWSDWVGGVAIELPILDRSGAATGASRQLAEAAHLESNDAAWILVAELDASLAALDAAARALQRHDVEILPRTREVLRMARLGYTEGKLGFLDLAFAQEALRDAAWERAGALIAHDLALTELETLLGRTLVPDSPSQEN